MENSTRCTAIERLNEAAKLGSLQLLNTLIEEDTNIVQKCLVSNCNSETPLHVSVSHGHLEFTRFLLDQNPELVVETNTLQRTPLHLASANGDIEMVRVLLEKNTSACLIRDLYGMIPLHYSAIKGHIQVTQDQSVINPPGGVLQEEQKFNNITIPSNIVFTRGTAVMLYYAIGGRGLFPWFLISNTLSVDPWCSVVVIVLILFRCSMSGMITGFLCTLAMCGAVGSLVLSYVTGVWIVTNGTVSEDDISALFKGVDNNIDFTKWGYIGALPVFMMVAGQVLTIMFHHFLHRIPASYSYTNKSRDSQGL